MNERLSESEILALIEGRVPSERAEAIREALRADPELAAEIRRMAADRDLMARLPKGMASPQGIVGAAMARAASERESAGRSDAARRRVAMAVAAGLGVAVLGGVLALVVRATHPGLQPAPVADSAEPGREIRMAGVEPEPAPAAQVGPLAEELESAGDVLTTAGEIGAKLAEMAESDRPDEVLEGFLRAIDERMDAASGPREWTDAELAGLVRSGRMEIVVTVVGPRGSAMAGDPAGAGGSAAVIPGSVVMDVPVDGEDAAVRAALEGAVRSLRADAGLRVEFRESMTAMGEGRSPTDPGAVVWWSGPPAMWRAVRTHTIPVRAIEGASVSGQ